MIKIDDTKRTSAIHRFISLAGLGTGEAEDLVDAMLQAAVDQALDIVMGSWPVPSALTTFRADQLRYVCLNVNRALTQREVSVLFRTTSASARTILTTMTATYEEALREKFLAEMRSNASVMQIGSVDAGLGWRVKFTQQSTYDTACSEVERLGYQKLIDADDSRLTIEFDQAGDDGSDILALLGLSPPATPRGRRR